MPVDHLVLKQTQRRMQAAHTSSKTTHLSEFQFELLGSFPDGPTAIIPAISAYPHRTLFFPLYHFIPLEVNQVIATDQNHQMSLGVLNTRKYTIKILAFGGLGPIICSAGGPVRVRRRKTVSGPYDYKPYSCGYARRVWSHHVPLYSCPTNCRRARTGGPAPDRRQSGSGTTSA